MIEDAASASILRLQIHLQVHVIRQRSIDDGNMGFTPANVMTTFWQSSHCDTVPRRTTRRNRAGYCVAKRQGTHNGSAKPESRLLNAFQQVRSWTEAIPLVFVAFPLFIDFLCSCFVAFLRQCYFRLKYFCTLVSASNRGDAHRSCCDMVTALRPLCRLEKWPVLLWDEYMFLFSADRFFSLSQFCFVLRLLF